MGIEGFATDTMCLDYIVLVGGKVISKLNGSPLDVVTDDSGVKYFQFECEPPEPPQFEDQTTRAYRSKHPYRMTVRADQVIAIVQEPINDED